MEHTHLVKGLDFALLQKVRAEIDTLEEAELDEEEEEVSKKSDEKNDKNEKNDQPDQPDDITVDKTNHSVSFNEYLTLNGKTKTTTNSSSTEDL